MSCHKAIHDAVCQLIWALCFSEHISMFWYIPSGYKKVFVSARCLLSFISGLRCAGTSAHQNSFCHMHWEQVCYIIFPGVIKRDVCPGQPTGLSHHGEILSETHLCLLQILLLNVATRFHLNFQVKVSLHPPGVARYMLCINQKFIALINHIV